MSGAVTRITETAQAALRARREPVMRHLVPALERRGLLVPAFRLYERALALGGRDDEARDGGLPLPPPYLRTLVVGSTSAEGFLASGSATAAAIRERFTAAGTDLERCDAVLDFGCGCGRVARWWPQEARTEWHACDVNPRLAAWCLESLPHLRMSVNPLEPPTSYRDERFDAIYAISVFTHWPEPLQHAWMADLARVLRPGGRLLFTTHGETAARSVLLDHELERFTRGELVVRFGEDPGSNLCNAYHPTGWVRERLCAGVEVLSHAGGGTLPGFGTHDVWVVGKP